MTIRDYMNECYENKTFRPRSKKSKSAIIDEISFLWQNAIYSFERKDEPEWRAEHYGRVCSLIAYMQGLLDADVIMHCVYNEITNRIWRN